jgi:hypothetical protein
MATFSCISAPDPVWFDLGFGPDIPFPGDVGDPVVADFPSICGMDTNVPVPVFPSSTFNCVTLPSFANLIEERILIRPRTIDTGTVFSDLVFQGVIWNNYYLSLQDAVLESIDRQNAEGITMSGIEEGDILPATLDRIIYYGILPDGPSIISASFEYNFDLQSVIQYLVGRRGSILLLEPQDSGYSESREFETSIFRAQAGREFRSQLSNDSVPNRSVSSTIKPFDRATLATLQNVLAYGTGYQILVPLWFSRTKLAENSNGSLPLLVVQSTENREFGGVRQIFIIGRKRGASLGTYAIRLVGEFTSDTITIDKPLEGFHEGDWVIPGISCSPPSNQSIRHILETRNEARLSFREIR